MKQSHMINGCKGKVRYISEPFDLENILKKRNIRHNRSYAQWDIDWRKYLALKV